MIHNKATNRLCDSALYCLLIFTLCSSWSWKIKFDVWKASKSFLGLLLQYFLHKSSFLVFFFILSIWRSFELFLHTMWAISNLFYFSNNNRIITFEKFHGDLNFFCCKLLCKLHLILQSERHLWRHLVQFHHLHLCLKYMVTSCGKPMKI